MKWNELLSAQLELPVLSQTADSVPFALPPLPDSAWEIEHLRELNGDWLLSAHTGAGVEATFTIKFFDDTRAAECWGTITNAGTQPVTGISQSLTLDTTLRLSPEFRRPWIRSITGDRYPGNMVFPPSAFAPVDQQLINPRQPFAKVRLSTSALGKTSTDHIPCAILSNEPQTAGVAFMLEWAGMWSMTFQHPVDHLQQPWDRPLNPPLNIQIGIDELLLDLHPGQSLPLPRLLIAAYDGDLEAGGNALRSHIRRHVTPSLDGAEVLPPTSFNQWFAFGNDFAADSMKAEVDASVAAGLEYFSIDGGWWRGGFPNGVGNWDDGDPQKFPRGIKPFADYVRRAGIKYGIFFEPERANVDSDLYRAHPEWFWSTPPGVSWRQTSTSSALMNFGLAEVRDWWLQRLVHAYAEWGVRWLRWDFNMNPRPNWEHDVPVGEIGLRQIHHVLGLYRTLDELMKACPDLFIEQTAGGGQRIELGLVRRGHSFWMSDVTEHTDHVRALQHGLNTVLPGNYPNTNLCQPRHDFTDYDYLSHAAGGFGYSGRLSKAPKREFERFARVIADYKRYRHVLLGDYSRPTGQPTRADEYAKVVFSDGAESVTMEFNRDGPGSARLLHQDGPQ